MCFEKLLVQLRVLQLMLLLSGKFSEESTSLAMFHIEDKSLKCMPHDHEYRLYSFGLSENLLIMFFTVLFIS